MKTYKILDILETLDNIRFERDSEDPVVVAANKKMVKLIKKLKK